MKREHEAIHQRKRLLEKAKAGVQKAFARKDASLIHAVRAIDDLDEIKSLLSQRLSEWVKINFPELALSEERTADVFAEFGAKEFFQERKLAELVGEQKAREVMEKAHASYGAVFEETDANAVRGIAGLVKDLFKTRRELVEFIQVKAKQAMPNISLLVEPLLAARLVSTAGGLEKLAGMPASTIQVIGAERALFKHLRSGSLPPKHGIIFQSTLINAAPAAHRGKIARALAAKLAIAAKADFYTGNFIALKLKQDLEKRLARIRGMPEKQKQRQPQQQRGRKGRKLERGER